MRPDFAETERPDPSEERTGSDGGGAEAKRPGPSEVRTAADAGEGGAEASHRAEAMEEEAEEIEVDPEVLYNDDLENEVSRDEGVQEPSTPPNVATMNYGQMPAFISTMTQASISGVICKYPWKRDYSIYVPQPDQSAALPPKGRVAIYVEQLEAGLRVPTTRFLRDCLRYWGVRITQLTPNTIRVLVGYQLLCRHQKIEPTVNLFRRCYSLKNSRSEKGWFYFGNKVPKLVYDTLSSIKEWKNNFIFVPVEDFPRGFWWRPPTSVKETSPGKLEERNFQKLTRSGLKINCWDFPERVLVEGGLSRALISSDHPILISTRLHIPCTFPFFLSCSSFLDSN